MPKQAQQTMTRAQIAEGLGVSVSTLRKYERLFQSYLSESATSGERGQGTANQYTREDWRVLATVHELRRAHVSFDDIVAGELDAALASGTVDFEPDTPKEEAAALVPVAQYAIVLGKLEATAEELEREREERQTLQNQLVDAEKRAAHAEAKAEERERIESELARVREELEEARRPWLARLFGRGRRG